MKISKLPITKLQKGPQFWWLFSLWWFTQFGVLLSPIALKVVGPLLLYSNSSRYGTNTPFQFPIWQLTSKETKRQAHHRPLCNRHNLHATPTNISHHSIMNQTWTRPTQHQDKPINNKAFIKCKQQREGEIEVRRDTRETRRYRWLTIILRNNTIFSLLCFDLFAFVPHSWSLLHMNAHQPLLWSDHVV